MGANMKIRMALMKMTLAACLLFLSQESYAFDLNGAWTTNGSACDSIFAKTKDNELLIKPDSDMYGDAIIVRNNSVVGKNATCTIKAKKIVGPVTHIVAVCAAGNVALSTFQFSYTIKDDNNIIRIFPGIEELNTTYARCLQ